VWGARHPERRGVTQKADINYAHGNLKVKLYLGEKILHITCGVGTMQIIQMYLILEGYGNFENVEKEPRNLDFLKQS
jgi:hypothetical protein